MMTDVISYLEHLAERNTGNRGGNGRRGLVPAEGEWPGPVPARPEAGEDGNGTGKD